MSSDPKETTQTAKSTTTKGPLDATRPLFEDVWSQTQSAINQEVPEKFVAGPTPWQIEAVNRMYGAAPETSTNALSLRDMAGKVASGYFLDPNNDPTFGAAVNAAINPVTKQLTERVLPQIVDQSIRVGGTGTGPAAYGGARQDIQENQAVDAWSQEAGNIAARMAADSRGRGMALIPQAGQIDNAATMAALMPSQVIGQAGTQQQAWDQAALQDQLMKFMFPFDFLQKAANIGATGGFSTGTSDSTQTMTQAAPDMATQWLQGITGGLGMLTSLAGMPGMGSIFGGMGSMLGGTGMGGGTNPWMMGTPAYMQNWGY